MKKERFIQCPYCGTEEYEHALVKKYEHGWICNFCLYAAQDFQFEEIQTETEQV